MPTVFYPAIYSKTQTLKTFEEMLKNSRSEVDIIIDLSRTGKGPYGTPAEIRQFLHLDCITVSLIDANVDIKFNGIIGTWKIIKVESKGTRRN